MANSVADSRQTEQRGPGCKKSRKGAALSGEMFDRWQSIGLARGLQCDVDIANFLVQHYENTAAAQCVLCHSPLTLCCLRCTSLPVPTPSLTNPYSPSPTTSAAAFPTSSFSHCAHEEEKPAVAAAARIVQTCSGMTGTCQYEHENNKHNNGELDMSCIMDNDNSNAVDSSYSCNNDKRNRYKDRGGDGVLAFAETVNSDSEKKYEEISDQKRPEALNLEHVTCLAAFNLADPHIQSCSVDISHQCTAGRTSFPLSSAAKQHTCTHPSATGKALSPSSSLKVSSEQTLSIHVNFDKTLSANEQDKTSSCLPDRIVHAETLKQGESLVSSSEEGKWMEDEHEMYNEDTDVESEFTAVKDICVTDAGLKDKQQRVLSPQEQNSGHRHETELEESIDKDTVSVSLSEPGRNRGTEDCGEGGKSHSSEGHRCCCHQCGQCFAALDELASHETCQPSINAYSSAHQQGRLQNLRTKHMSVDTECSQQPSITVSSSQELHHQMHNHTTELVEKIPLKELPFDRTDPAHVCDVCCAVFSNSLKLRAHKKMVHKEQRKFQCRFCGKELCNMQTLATHERTHTGAKPFQCSQCPSTFRSSSNLRAHLRTHSGHTPYLCPQCGRGFKEITHLKRHLVSHSGERPYKCQECGKAYVHATSLKEHLLSHSASAKCWVCHQCGKAFINSKKLKVHLKVHTNHKGAHGGKSANGKLFVCPVCGATYRQSSSLSRHKKLHQKGVSKHACKDCGKSFRDKYELKKHCHSHNGATLYQCPQCPRSFSDNSSFRRHCSSHSKQKPHRCPQCNKNCTDYKTLQEHLQSHTGLRLHTCSWCSKAFFTPWTLRLHLQCHAVEKNGLASQGKSHRCGKCGASYVHASSLIRHQRLHDNTQGQNTRYQCPQCSRSFGDSSHLKRHLLSHSGEKPFVCAACGKAYADSHTLKDHMQVHTGVRSFICEVCGKAFYNAKTLKEHARSHSDLRPFQCSQCSAAYKHLSGLTSHRRIHSGVRPFTCKDCSKTFKDYACYKRHQLTHSHFKPHVCQQCGKAYKDLKNLRHHQVKFHGNPSSRENSS